MGDETVGMAGGVIDHVFRGSCTEPYPRSSSRDFFWVHLKAFWVKSGFFSPLNHKFSFFELRHVGLLNDHTDDDIPSIVNYGSKSGVSGVLEDCIGSAAEDEEPAKLSVSISEAIGIKSLSQHCVSFLRWIRARILKYKRILSFFPLWLCSLSFPS